MAPFAYANTWGAAYAFFLPFFVITWIVRAERRRRIAGILVLLASLWPVVYSLDRGLWIALGVAVCFAGLKIVARGGGRALRLAAGRHGRRHARLRRLAAARHDPDAAPEPAQQQPALRCSPSRACAAR